MRERGNPFPLLLWHFFISSPSNWLTMETTLDNNELGERKWTLEPPEERALRVSKATETAVELPSLLALIADGAATDLGSRRVLGLRPTADRKVLETRRRRFDEIRRLMVGQSVVASRERPVQPILNAMGGVSHQLEGTDLIEIAALLRGSSRLIRRIADSESPFPALSELTQDVPNVDDLLHLLERTFDARGQIREDATPRLSELRRRIRSVRQNIYDQMHSLVDVHREHLSEETVPMRGGRLVLVLQAGARGRVPGLVHGRSGSGKSFYFEPLESVEGNNQLQQAVEDEESEKRRIFAEVLSKLQENIEAIRIHAACVGEFDLHQAAARFAETCDGKLAELSGRHDLKLKQARHPLLDPRFAALRRDTLGQEGHTGNVVPLDVEMSEHQRALVLTGPNAGGKTVTLKTTGLLALMHQCGLPIPAAAGSRLPVLEALVATVGDDQDLLADRSTFSGRLLRLREAWDLSGQDSLVLLDELGSGTDPEEGAALSSALLEGLVSSHSLVLVTTHLSQVAATALETEGAFCAAMQFDSSTGEPTYRLVPGPPGGSEALALAHRLGLPSSWLDRAEQLLGSDHRNLRLLLAEVERHRQELAEAQSRLASEVQDAEVLRRRLEEREAELLQERRTVGKKLKEQLETFRREVQDQLRSEVEKATEQVQQGRRKGIASQAVQRIFERAPQLEPEIEVKELPLKVGAPVRHRRLGWVGVLEKLERGRAQVVMQGKSLVCKEKELVGVDPESAEVDRKTRRPSAERRRVQPTAGRSDVDELTPESELFLIGQRVEPALTRLDRFLDKSLLASVGSVRIIHGHGSGRLRDAVRNHLNGHPAVATQRPGKANEGGDGATVAVLAS